MSVRNCPTNSFSTCFEDLPNEIILSICRYLSQVDILDSFLNINSRLNQTISSYRERIFLSHLNYENFHHLLSNHLPSLASNVCYLYINTSSMINAGKIFENYFTKIDVQFPLLNELVLYQIDIETVENLSWRFNTMYFLRRLQINISEERLASRPVLFDEFLCGKLFSQSNSFESLEISFPKYYFHLSSLKKQCPNLRQLTISVRNLADLLLLFEYLPNLEKLDVTLSCSSWEDEATHLNMCEQLWWKVPHLTDFSLTLKEESLTSHSQVPSSGMIFKIIANLYSLKHLKFCLDIQFVSLLQMITNTEIYVDKYFPFLDGTLWERALRRNDNHNIAFEFYVELGGLRATCVKEGYYSDTTIASKNNDVDYQSHLRTTFSSAYWLQKNLTIQCFTSASKHVSIYTLPITLTNRSTIVDIIDKDISISSSISHRNVENLLIHSDPLHHSPSLSLRNLLNKYPRLIYLNVNAPLLLPPVTTIYSTRLRSLTLYDCTLSDCSHLLECLPRVISLAITCSKWDEFQLESCIHSFRSILRLKLDIYRFLSTDLPNLKENFPCLKELHLKIHSITTGSLHDYSQYKIFEDFLSSFLQLRYAELYLPIEKHFDTPFSKTEILSSKCMIERTKSSDSRCFLLKKWT